MMAKIKKGFFWTWAIATVLLVLFAWWQTGRLKTAAAERDQMRSQTISTLLGQAEGLLDSAADQVQAKNYGTAQSTAGAAIAMFEAGAQVADEELAREITERADQTTRLRASINEGDPEGSTADLLRSEATQTREMARQAGLEPQAPE
jgi:hypothetical protein